MARNAPTSSSICSRTLTQTTESIRKRARSLKAGLSAASEGVQVVAAGEALAEAPDASLLAIQGDDQFAVQQEAGKVPDAAAHLDHAVPQFPYHQTALPGEIILRAGHLALVFEGKLGGRLPHLSLTYHERMGFLGRGRPNGVKAADELSRLASASIASSVKQVRKNLQ